MQQALNDLEKILNKEREFNLEKSKYKRIEKHLSKMENISYFVGLVITLSMTYTCSIACTKSLRLDATAVIIALYLAFALSFYIHPVIQKLLTKVVFMLNKANQREYDNYLVQRNTIRQRKLLIEDRIYGQQKELRKQQEHQFIGELEDLVNQTSGKTTTASNIVEMLKRLKEKYHYLNLNGLQVKTNVFYQNRFLKIETFLNSKFNSQQIYPNVSGDSPSEKNGNEIMDSKKHQTSDSSQNDLTLEISDIKTNSKVENITPESDNNKIRHKVDFEKLNVYKHSIGQMGEEFIYHREKRKFLEKGMPELSEKIKWMSLNSDSYGYDILSFCDDGRLKYIEVKTTTESHTVPFYLSETELTAMNTMDDYFIYRVFNFNIEKQSGKVFTVTKLQLKEHFGIQPASYRVTPKFH